MYQPIDTRAACHELSTANDFIRLGISAFNQTQCYFGHGTNNAYDEAVQLVLHALSLDYSVPADLLNSTLLETEKRAIIELFQDRIQKRIPAPYLTHKAYFAQLSFYVDERVIIPRSPMAEIIEKQFEPWHRADTINNVLDLCTGSGCIAIACAHYLEEAHVDAIEFSKEAFLVAQRNIDEHAMQNRVSLIRSDLFSALEPSHQYDIIVSNPPYVDENEMTTMPDEYKHEPKLALESGLDGLEHAKRILKDASKFLKIDGKLFLEVGASAIALENQYPHVPFTWVELERGGFGVLCITRQELEKYFSS